MKMSEETKTILHDYGWSAERKVCTTKYEKAFECEGYKTFKSALDFLREFGGIYFEIPIPNSGIKGKAHFDAIQATKDIYIEVVQAYEHRVGERLLPVGEANNYQCTLLFSESGKMYAGLDDTLLFLGNNYEEAIENLCQRLDKAAIPIIDN